MMTRVIPLIPLLTNHLLLHSILVLASIVVDSSHSLTTDGVLLLSFKFSILNDPFHVLDTWIISDPTPCSWRGITCSATNISPRVTAVSLPECQLLGSLPANLGLLDHLQSLNLSGNSINGSIPDTLFSLPDLRILDFSDNLISGEIPGSVGRLRSLEMLNLSENALSGNIPTNLAGLENLTAVSLRGNYFSGYLPGGFHRVESMDLSSNLINGSLPVDFGGGRIQYLNVSYNRISGEIPPEFSQGIQENSTLDFSYNNLTGEIPDSGALQKQGRDSFTGNSDLCGPPSGHPCPNPSSPTSMPMVSESDKHIAPPAIAAVPKTLKSPVLMGSPGVSPIMSPNNQQGKNIGLRPQIIAAIVVGDLAGIAILFMVFLYMYRRKNTPTTTTTTTTSKAVNSKSSSYSSSSSSSKGIAKWSCLPKVIKSENEEEEEEEEEKISEEEDAEEVSKQDEKEQGKLVTVDGDNRELEMETLLKASAYILGASGASIIYKAVLEDGNVLAVRRVGDCTGAERFKDFESHVRAIGKVVHANLVRLRGFYWGADEKLLIYDYVPNGNLANVRHRKNGSSPCHIPWEVRLRIAKGVARGLNYIHEKKQVHGNLKPNNILLEMDMEPKIGDFGLDRLTTGKSGYVSGWSTRHFGSKRSTASRESFQDLSVGAATPSPSASSIGCVSPYHPPESLRSLKSNPKWDVYSFGVMLLELLTGKVVVSDELGPPVLAGLAVGLDDKTRVLRMADVAIRADLEGKEEAFFACLKLGYNCVSHVPQKRPSMKEALQTLEKIPTTSSSTPSYYYGP